jgi:hypothetical protein
MSKRLVHFTSVVEEFLRTRTMNNLQTHFGTKVQITGRGVVHFISRFFKNQLNSRTHKMPEKLTMMYRYIERSSTTASSTTYYGFTPSALYAPGT